MAGHQTAVTALAFSADGRYLASGDRLGTVVLWRGPDWRPVHRLDWENAVGQLIFDRQTRRLLVVAGPTLSTIALDNPSDRQEIPVPPYRYAQEIKACLSPDGTTLAVGRGHLYLYDYPSLRLSKTRRYAEEHGSIVEFENLAFDPNGKELAVMLGSVAAIDRINLEDGTVKQDFAVTGEPITHTYVIRQAMGYSGDGAFIAVSNNHGLALFRMDSMVTKMLWGHRDLIHALAFTVDGRLMISAGADQQIIGRQLPSGNQTFAWRRPASVRALAVSPDGATLASAGVDHAICLWSLTDPARDEPFQVLGTPVPTINHLPDQSMPHPLRRDRTLRFVPYILVAVLFLITGFRGLVATASKPPIGALLILFTAISTFMLITVDKLMLQFSLTNRPPFSQFCFQLFYYGMLIVAGARLCHEMGWRACLFDKAPGETQSRPWWQRLMKACGEGTAVFFLLVVYTWLLFESFPPANFGFKVSNPTVSNPTVIKMMLLGINEEILFRLGLFVVLAYLLKKSRWATPLAAVVSAMLFSFFHLYNLDPLWLKWLQILPFGLLMCWLFRRHGIEVCMLVHVSFNGLIHLILPSF